MIPARPWRRSRIHAPRACEVNVVLERAAKALVLSLAWYSTDQEGDDVAALLELVWRDARLPAKRVFSSIGKVKFEVDLFAVAVFQNAHYTAFVRARDGSDSWTYHDRRSAVAVGTFANVVQQPRPPEAPNPIESRQSRHRDVRRAPGRQRAQIESNRDNLLHRDVETSGSGHWTHMFL